MAIAKYFSKDLLAINQLLKTNNKNLQDTLAKIKIGLCFDSNSIDTKEGKKSLDLLVRLLARLYPVIAIVDLTRKSKSIAIGLADLAKSINSQIDIKYSLESCNVAIVAGETTEQINCETRLFVGSDNWIAKFSPETAQAFKDSENPFGCGVAACIACANLFKIVFKEFFSTRPLDTSLEFSVIDLDSTPTRNPSFSSVDIGELTIVGVGAIGNGTIWGLLNYGNATGKINLVDHETISLSNLQRYILFKEEDINQPKVNIAAKNMVGSPYSVRTFHNDWANYLKEISNWQISTVAVAIDNKKDRISIQSSLPKLIFNAYTEDNLIGVASHLNFTTFPCLACGYIPTQKEKNYTEEVAVNCNIPQHANFVKDYLNLNLSVDSVYNNNTISLLDIIATTNGIERSILNQFNGKKVNQFYSEFVCGGISLSLSNVEPTTSTNVDAPLAFQSALAGLLLASRIVVDSLDAAKPESKQQMHLHPLNAIGKHNPYKHNLQKDTTGSCLCADITFVETYKQKWSDE